LAGPRALDKDLPFLSAVVQTEERLAIEDLVIGVHDVFVAPEEVLLVLGVPAGGALGGRLALGAVQGAVRAVLQGLIVVVPTGAGRLDTGLRLPIIVREVMLAHI